MASSRCAPRFARPFAASLPLRRLAAAFVALAALSAAGCGARKPPRAMVPSIGASQTGVASWYGDPYHGRRTASGEVYDMNAWTAAHPTFVFGTWLRVRNLDNGKITEVRVNDRGPFVKNRIVDLSRASAREIDMIGPGTARVRLTVIRLPEQARANKR